MNNSVTNNTKYKENGVINFYEIMPKKFLETTENPNYHYHKIKLPLRGLVVAPSGFGKTNLLLNLIKVFSDKTKNVNKMGSFYDIHVYTKNKDEPIYNYLASLSPSIFIHEDLTTLKLDKFDKKYAHLVVFDDLVLNKDQKPMAEFFMRCRKLNTSCIYLSQSFFMTPKFIRQNCNAMWILKLAGQREVNIILKEFSLGVDKEILLKMYDYATNERFYPLMIDLEASCMNNKFRKGLFEFINIGEFS